MRADKHDAPSPAPDGDDKPTKRGEATDDVVLLHSRSQDGQGVNVIRKQGDVLHAGQLRPVEEGKPLSGDLVSLQPRQESPALFNVVTHYRQPKHGRGDGDGPREPQTARTRSGPAQVSSDGYRTGWDSIWGKKSRKAPLN